MNKLSFCVLMFMIFVLPGCVIRSIPYDVDRADQEIKGNRGVVRGDTSSVPITERKKTKRMYNIEIELPMKESDKVQKTERSSVSGNKGNIQTSRTYREKPAVAKEQKSATKTVGGDVSSAAPQVVYQMSSSPAEDKYKKEKGAGTVAEKEEKMYVVKKGDTLQKISDKMYGTTKKWKKIYEANKDVLKSPDMIKPGQKLVIPSE